MNEFRALIVGWPRQLIDGLCAGIESRSAARYTYVAHPRETQSTWPAPTAPSVRFFRETSAKPIADGDPALLASLEAPGVPSVHNMILGDRVVRQVGYPQALAYATFLARRLFELYEELRPSVVIGGFDALHGGLSLAVAKRLGIPWFAMHFSVIPPGLACFCDRMSPAARVAVSRRPEHELRQIAESALRQFEDRTLRAPAYLAPPRSLARTLSRLPARIGTFAKTVRRSHDRDFAQFTDVRTRYDALAAIRALARSRGAYRAAGTADALDAPPAGRYVLFGLHMQPESSIDVWAPFFSNQPWVIELIARSIPPTHRLLVKIHKSDVANHSAAELARMRSLPGVELVRPFSDARPFIEKADLVIAIQGTMGLEAALLGRPVLLLGDSPVRVFPSAMPVGAIDQLPELVRAMLGASPPSRLSILEAYATYLAPFLPASHNDWRAPIDTDAVENYARLFEALRRHLASPARIAAGAVT